jgi:hypothetical protein
MGEEERNLRIRNIIATAFLYGEFYLAINHGVPEEEYARDVLALEYLIENGFAINRHDIIVDGRIYRQLTDKGRSLKKCGSMEAYRLLCQEQDLKMEYEIDKKDREAQRNIYQYWINVSIALSTGIAGVYYTVQLYDGTPKSHPYLAFFLCLGIILVLSVIISQLLKNRK